jgi:hypothetical protein
MTYGGNLTSGVTNWITAGRWARLTIGVAVVPQFEL